MVTGTLGRTLVYKDSHPWITFKLHLEKAPPMFWMLLGEACSKCQHIKGVPLLPETSEELHRVYLEKGARATTAIEGNTLTEEDVSRLARGELELPASKEYLGAEVRNILGACNEILSNIANDREMFTDADRIKSLNRQVLNGLALDDEVEPGVIRTYDVVVGRYRGAPPADCDILLTKLCEWLRNMSLPEEFPELALPILQSIMAHLYIAWIHPFGDGNGRTARLVEFLTLVSSGIPSPAAHLLSNHYNETRSEYYRQLDRSIRSKDGAMDFALYALQGFVDGLTTQIDTIREQTLEVTWTNYVHEQFSDRDSVADTRRRHLVLDLSKVDGLVPRRDIRTLTPRLAEAYLDRTSKTITRDINVLKRMGLISQSRAGIRANKEMILAFLPLTSPTD